MTVEYYAQKLLNPFRGCIQVIRHASAEAVSMDGVHWDIYVSNDSLLADLEGATSATVQISDIRYGSWSEEKGLKRGPLYPSEDFYRMEAMGNVVYEHLLQLHDQVPFPYGDHYECWLLDGEGRPLVLVDSAVGANDALATGTERWQIGLAAIDHFNSPTLAAAHPESAGRHGQYLMDYINGLGTHTVWFYREPEGPGTPLRPETDQPLPASAFPALLIGGRHDDAHTRLIADLHAWQAPWLLQLSGIPVDTRRRLEHQARTQAHEVDRRHRLYPEVVDPDLIQAARVEARLMRHMQTTGPAETEPDLSTFYIELNPSGPE